MVPPINDRATPVRADRDRLAEIAVLVNSGALATAIDEIVDDPELTL